MSTSAAAMPRPNRIPITVPPFAVRMVTVAALTLFGAQSWGGMVRPSAEWRMLGAAVVGLALAGALVWLGGRPRFVRIGGRLAATVGGVAAALLFAGVPLHLLDLESWGELSSGLWQGISALPGLNVPYRGLDEWNRIAMILGGTTLAIAAPVLACQRRRGAGVVLLCVLYAVPAVQMDVAEPFLEGALFALLLGAVLWAERLQRSDARLAASVAVVAALAGILFAPALDGRDPWVDYEELARSLSERGQSTFSWNHSYGPLDWPRDGREVLRIGAEVGAYWKATTLTEFDGRRWVEVHSQGIEDDPEADRPSPRWIQDIRVSVRNLSTRQFIAAGTTMRIERAPRTPVDGAPGSFVSSGRPLHRGHAYLARTYVPRPRALQLEATGANYPTSLWPFMTMRVPPSLGGPAVLSQRRDELSAEPAFVIFSAFGDPRPALGYLGGRGVGERIGSQWVEDSAWARTYALSKRLARDATSPYGYVRAVQEYLSNGFTYSEAPPQGGLALDRFLFEHKTGYCQQFSGAMALLLRMGGVPARVATGFSPGTRDAERGEYVVRDLDAHSWVEAYFVGYGWIPFDPTPAVAPPRAQLPALDEEEEESDEEAGGNPASLGGERATDPQPLGGEQAQTDDGLPWFVWAGGILAAIGLVLACAYAIWAVRLRRRYGPEVAVAELLRALRRTGRAARPGATLAQLESTLRSSPEAAGYVHSVREARFGYGAAAPTRAQRRALRRELASGLGLRGRLRALWALPPF